MAYMRKTIQQYHNPRQADETYKERLKFGFGKSDFFGQGTYDPDLTPVFVEQVAPKMSSRAENRRFAIVNWRNTSATPAAQRARAQKARRPMIQLNRPVMGGNGRMPGVLRSNSGEVKALDVPFTTYTLNTAMQITALNLIRTGSTFCNRIGRRIEMKNLRISGMVIPLRTQAVHDYCRIIVVYDRQTNGALPAQADILQTTDQAAANTSGAFSGLNLNNRDRFVTLMDDRFQLPALTLTAGQVTTPGFQDQTKESFFVERFIKLKGLLTQYKADSSPAVIGDIATGGLYLCTIGLANAAGAEGYSVDIETRLRFRDN